MTPANSAWKRKLPNIYSWCKEVGVEFNSFQPRDTLQIIFCHSDTKSLSLISEDLPKNLEIVLSAWIQKRTWEKFKTPILLNILETDCLLVPTKTMGSHVASLRQTGLEIAKFLLPSRYENLAFWDGKSIDLTSVLDGYISGLYKVTFLQSKDSSEDSPYLPKKLLLSTKNDDMSAIKIFLNKMQSIVFTRFLQDCPSNYMNPSAIVSISQEILEEKGLSISVLRQKELREESMGAFLSVAKGASDEPALVIVDIPGLSEDKLIAVVGKGVTMDTGGLSLKPSIHMVDMKYDMSGAADILGLAHYLGSEKPQYHTKILLGATENMLSKESTKPGDIVVSRSRKTIEVLNTDAEGRLVLADLLNYAQEVCKADILIDIATLTGAVSMAFGSAGAAIMGNDRKLIDQFLQASTHAGERFGELPLWEEYRQELVGTIADLKNIADSHVRAGSILAGLFLNEFIKKEQPWIHLDIAGCAFNAACALGFPKKGGSAFGLRTLIEFLKKF